MNRERFSSKKSRVLAFSDSTEIRKISRRFLGFEKYCEENALVSWGLNLKIGFSKKYFEA